MKKTIIKTAVITLVALIVASGVLFGILCLCAPATMRDFFYDAGNYQTAMNFAERACEKNETPENIKNINHPIKIMNSKMSAREA